MSAVLSGLSWVVRGVIPFALQPNGTREAGQGPPFLAFKKQRVEAVRGFRRPRRSASCAPPHTTEMSTKPAHHARHGPARSAPHGKLQTHFLKESSGFSRNSAGPLRLSSVAFIPEA